MTQAISNETLILEKLSELSEGLSDVRSDVSDMRSVLATVQSDVFEIKLSQARADEKLNALDERLSLFREDVNSKFTSLESEMQGQNSRLWTLVTGLLISLAAVIVGFFVKSLFAAPI